MNETSEYNFPFFPIGTTVRVLDDDDDNGRVGTIEVLERPWYDGTLPYLIRFSENDASWVRRVEAVESVKVEIPLIEFDGVFPSDFATGVKLLKVLSKHGVEVTF